MLDDSQFENFDPQIFDCGDPRTLDGSEAEPAISEFDPDVDEVDRIGLRRICTICSEEGGALVFMEIVRATEAGVYSSSSLDSDVPFLWAVCPICGSVRLLGDTVGLQI